MVSPDKKEELTEFLEKLGFSKLLASKIAAGGFTLAKLKRTSVAKLSECISETKAIEVIEKINEVAAEEVEAVDDTKKGRKKSKVEEAEEDKVEEAQEDLEVHKS
ncbi:MAG: hypothetical protein JSV49_09445, partial [Thermoplasmata archaeon]